MWIIFENESTFSGVAWYIKIMEKSINAVSSQAHDKYWTLEDMAANLRKYTPLSNSRVSPQMMLRNEADNFNLRVGLLFLANKLNGMQRIHYALKILNHFEYLIIRMNVAGRRIQSIRKFESLQRFLRKAVCILYRPYGGEKLVSHAKPDLKPKKTKSL